MSIRRPSRLKTMKQLRGLGEAKGNLAEPTCPGGGSLNVAGAILHHSGLVATEDTVWAAFVDLFWVMLASRRAGRSILLLIT
jgi:hypothetical protein